jgi:hypothetical protein
VRKSSVLDQINENIFFTVRKSSVLDQVNENRFFYGEEQKCGKCGKASLNGVTWTLNILPCKHFW